MADGKKRKRDGEGSGKPKKKVVIDAPASTIKISSVLQPKSYPPIIASSPGLSIPSNIPFQSYTSGNATSSKKGKSSKKAGREEHMLHSTAHRTLEYTAKEDMARGQAPAMNHFIGIYDPKTGNMQVVEVRKMTVRGSVRAKQVPETTSTEKTVFQTNYERKTDLGQTFGTKKAKKAIQANVMNAIAPQRKKGDTAPVKLDDATKAMLKSVGDITSNMSTREQLQAVVDEAKPVPRPNLEAEEVADVYDPNVIIGGDILRMVPIREWQEKAKGNESIQLVSRYVASRLNPIATNDSAVTRLRVLRYMAFVLSFYLNSKPGKQRGTRSLPPRDKLRELLAPAPEAVIENIRRKFSESGTMRKFHIDLLMAHCCAYACIIDNFEVDTRPLMADLRVDQKMMNSYFHEIGGRVKDAKISGTTIPMGRLSLPLDFPKQRSMAPRRK